MTVRVRLTPAAEEDLSEAYAWYENAQRGLGERFLEAIMEQIQTIADWPQSAPVVHRDVRRALVRRFPYGVFYVIDGDDLVVIGCFHARRDPSVWKRRFP